MTRILAVCALLVLPVSSLSAAEFQEGQHYARLAVPVDTVDASKVEVVEVFSYACIHCKTFDPTLEEWRLAQADDVLFRRVPAIFNQTWALFAQAFYTAELLGVTDRVHTPMFTAIHDEGVDLRDPSLLAELFNQAAGVPPAEFTQVFNSFGVRSRVQQADAHGRAYGITGVPTLIVDGRFRVDGTMAGNNTNMLLIVDFLVEQQRATRLGAGTPVPVPAAPGSLDVE
ncbi:MAG: thiol:disulfide interchange protein DsbA/DsbL [Pseudomonadales bacterium]|nr:thiol:disulfide interchange protein DsbA/DsbL [Pseudomonadales bacterium]